MCEGTPPYFFNEFYFISIFLLILMNMQNENLHISLMNKKTMSALKFGTRVSSQGLVASKLRIIL